MWFGLDVGLGGNYSSSEMMLDLPKSVKAGNYSWKTVKKNSDHGNELWIRSFNRTWVLPCKPCHYD